MYFKKAASFGGAFHSAEKRYRHRRFCEGIATKERRQRRQKSVDSYKMRRSLLKNRILRGFTSASKMIFPTVVLLAVLATGTDAEVEMIHLNLKGTLVCSGPVVHPVLRPAVVTLYFGSEDPQNDLIA